jgi:hypothetical protein
MRIALVESCSRAVTPDALFDALDGRWLGMAGGTWQLEVYSVHDEQGSRWIQAALRGDKLLPVTIKLTAEASIADALSKVAARLAETAEGDTAIDISSDPASNRGGSGSVLPDPGSWWRGRPTQWESKIAVGGPGHPPGHQGISRPFRLRAAAPPRWSQ